MDIVREDPPQTRGARRAESSSGIIKALKADPGNFYRILEYSNKDTAYITARMIKRGERAGFTAGQFDAVGRSVDGRGVVYARYIG